MNAASIFFYSSLVKSEPIWLHPEALKMIWENRVSWCFKPSQPQRITSGLIWEKNLLLVHWQNNYKFIHLVCFQTSLSFLGVTCNICHRMFCFCNSRIHISARCLDCSIEPLLILLRLLRLWLSFFSFFLSFFLPLLLEDVHLNRMPGEVKKLILLSIIT